MSGQSGEPKSAAKTTHYTYVHACVYVAQRGGLQVLKVQEQNSIGVIKESSKGLFLIGEVFDRRCV